MSLTSTMDHQGKGSDVTLKYEEAKKVIEVIIRLSKSSTEKSFCEKCGGDYKKTDFAAEELLVFLRKFPALASESFDDYCVMTLFLRNRASLQHVREVVDFDPNMAQKCHPLHQVCLYGASEGVLEFLLEKFPDEVRHPMKVKVDHDLDMLLVPALAAFETSRNDKRYRGERDQVLQTLLNAYPEAMLHQTRNGKSLFSRILENGTSTSEMKTFLISKHPVVKKEFQISRNMVIGIEEARAFSSVFQGLEKLDINPYCMEHPKKLFFI